MCVVSQISYGDGELHPEETPPHNTERRTSSRLGHLSRWQLFRLEQTQRANLQQQQQQQSNFTLPAQIIGKKINFIAVESGS